MPFDDIERDATTQDIEGRTLTITPSFTLLSSLNDVVEKNKTKKHHRHHEHHGDHDNDGTNGQDVDRNEGDIDINDISNDMNNENMNHNNNMTTLDNQNYDEALGDEDWSDFVVLDTGDDNNGDDDTPGGEDDSRKLNDTFLPNDRRRSSGGHQNGDGRVGDSRSNNGNNGVNYSTHLGGLGGLGGGRGGDGGFNLNEAEERHLDDDGLRKRSPRKIEMKLLKSPSKMRKDKEKKSSDSLSEMNSAVNAVLSKNLSQRDFMSTIRKVTSTIKFPGKKYSDTWMSKINGSENGRPLMFRVGSTCMTMSNLVNENRDRENSTKSDHSK